MATELPVDTERAYSDVVAVFIMQARESIMRGFVQDGRFALRQLLKSPGFATTALLTLALGIGANVVVFSVLNALLLRPLDVPQPAGLYNIVHAAHGYDNQSYPDYVDFRSRNNFQRYGGISAGECRLECEKYRLQILVLQSLGKLL